MIEWLKESLIGIFVAVICWVSYVLYIHLTELCDEDSKKGNWCKKLGKIGSRAFIIYMTIFTIIGLIGGIILLFKR